MWKNANRRAYSDAIQQGMVSRSANLDETELDGGLSTFKPGAYMEDSPYIHEYPCPEEEKRFDNCETEVELNAGASCSEVSVTAMERKREGDSLG